MNSSPIAKAEDLDEMRCSNPKCKEDHGTLGGVMEIHSVCHQEAAVKAAYLRGLGVLALVCSECGGGVAMIAVARKVIQ